MAITFNSDLISDLANRRVVLFLGAGVSASAIKKDGGRFKGWVDVLNAAAEKLKGKQNKDRRKLIERYIKEGDYLLACELLRMNLGSEWSKILSQEFSGVAEPSELHKAIFSLNQRIIITTNFDKLIESFHDKLTKSSYYPTVKSKIDDTVFKMFRENNDYIIKLHGTVDEEGEVIFDKSSYSNNAFGNPFYSELLNVLLLTHTFVFIGFSMDDPAVSAVVELYANKYQSVRPHYIFVSGEVDPQIADIWKRLRKMYVIPYDPKDGHKELVDSLKSLSKQVNMARKEMLSELASP